ncbi:MAG TPA: hemerythrin domain-containing protein [Pyrinomonadaceae bacterium]|nr:hemerythrin domain-containing protein [Pyrinomonadaceae bacterium]
MTFTITTPLKLEHDELHADLVKATQAGGQVGDAAKALAKVLHEHFLKEEEFALPPLGLLSALARDQVDEDMKTVVPMTDRLKAELPEMLQEHEAVVGALKTLITAAEADNKPEHARFAEKLILHARTEEEVLYPTAILIGEYLKLRLRASSAIV